LRIATKRPAETRTIAPLEPARRQPSIGLALGGGGARGLAHVVMLEAFDELGIKPKIISGTSIGAIYGAAYASGLSAREIRSHTEEVLSQRLALLRDLFAARAQPLQRLLNVFSAPSAIFNADALLDFVMPKGTKAAFEDLEIPLKIVASDFYDQEQAIFTSGPLMPAVAASMALPAVFEPVIIKGRALVDGGLTNPLPFDLLTNDCDIVVAIDVSGTPVPNPKRDHPSALEALFSSAFLFERSIVREKLKSAQPDILIHAGTGQFQVLEFLKHAEILAAALPAKERLKAQLGRVLSVETLAQIARVPAPEIADKTEARQSKPRDRNFLKRKPRTRGDG
jgi:NTE family protein